MVHDFEIFDAEGKYHHPDCQDPHACDDFYCRWEVLGEYGWVIQWDGGLHDQLADHVRVPTVGDNPTDDKQ